MRSHFLAGCIIWKCLIIARNRKTDTRDAIVHISTTCCQRSVFLKESVFSTRTCSSEKMNLIIILWLLDRLWSLFDDYKGSTSWLPMNHGLRGQISKESTPKCILSSRATFQLSWMINIFRSLIIALSLMWYISTRIFSSVRNVIN